MQYAIRNHGAIILAAGGSTRMGKPKQLLEFGGRNLLEHAVTAVRGLGDLPLCIVLGAEAVAIREHSDLKGCLAVVNEQWAEGMSGSITCGIRAISSSFPDMDGVLIIVCDQPYLNTALLAALIEAQNRSGKPMAACRYEGILGTPALFHVSTFPELLALEGDRGARKIVEKDPRRVAVVPFEQGGVDIDTPADYEKLKQS